jgi:hypothetical protein
MKRNTSNAQFVFDHLDEIEHKISMGIYHAAIVDDLAQIGHEMTLESFRKCLSRARSKNKQHQIVNQSIGPIDDSQILQTGRLTPEELAQIEKMN